MGMRCVHVDEGAVESACRFGLSGVGAVWATSQTLDGGSYTNRDTTARGFLPTRCTKFCPVHGFGSNEGRYGWILGRYYAR